MLPRSTSDATEARSAVYALFSQLVASPFDAPSVVAALPPSDLPALTHQLEERLPYDFDLEPLARVAAHLDDSDAERLAVEYSRLFEVSGAPVPLREELAPETSDKAKEETLRFYDFFGYTLTEARQWAPDHLSVQLEFMHFLSFKAAREEDPDQRSSYRRAQRDFLERHLCSWIPRVVVEVRRHAGEPYWIAVFSALGAFLPADADWLRQRAS